jgi:hypothetical protein
MRFLVSKGKSCGIISHLQRVHACSEKRRTSVTAPREKGKDRRLPVGEGTPVPHEIV